MRRLLLFLLLSWSATAATYYIAAGTAGNDSNSCTLAQDGTAAHAKRTFNRPNGLFSCGGAGDTYVLLDGTYTSTNGSMNAEFSDYSGMPPNGTSNAIRTIVRAQNPGMVKIAQQTWIGSISQWTQYITFDGIMFEAPQAFISRHSKYITLKNCTFHGTGGGIALGLGMNDNNEAFPSTEYMLVEDCWAWSGSRSVMANFWSRNNVWRRVVGRNEGCASGDTDCVNGPSLGMTVYYSQNTSVQNMFFVDSLATNMNYVYGDYAQASHPTYPVPNINNEYLGVISLHSQLYGMTMDPEESSGTVTLKDILIWDSAGGFIGMLGGATWNLSNFTINSSGSTGDAMSTGITLVDVGGGSIQNVIVMGTGGNYAIASDFRPSYVDLLGTWAMGNYQGAACTTGCRSTNPTSDGTPASIKYPVRIETGSALYNAGAGGNTNIGATIVKRYGVSGSIAGETNYNTLTTENLWPWPNEARIKKEMCTDVGVTRGFCSDTSLTNYIMNYLGNGNPYSDTSAPNTIVPGPASVGGGVTIH